MSSLDEAFRVLERYPTQYQPRRVSEFRHRKSFSGARIWRVESSAGPLCLRRWPPGRPDFSGLQFIHSVLRHAQREGFQQLPVPFADQHNQTIVVVDGNRWELTPWLPGAADHAVDPSRERLSQAFETLAHFHRATATYPECPDQPEPSPRILQRSAQLRRLSSGELANITAALATAPPEIKQRGIRVLDLFPRVAPLLETKLAAARQQLVRLQPCICDVWRDHVLFSGVQVTGLIDFGAMWMDTPACDVARLAGSFAADRQELRQVAIDAYSHCLPLSPAQRVLVEIFDQSAVLLAGINWLQWICIERKRFDLQHVLTRLDEIILRLEHQSSGQGLWLG